MAKQFDPRRVLKQISNALLKQFFTARNELADVPWDTLKETDMQSVIDAWNDLPELQQREGQVILQEVNELADNRGLAVLADEIKERSPTRLSEFAAVESRIDKALWAYLTVPAAFAEASRFALADTMATGRYWHKRNGLPKSDQPLAITDEMKLRLGEKLAAFYAKAQARGRWCHVEHYRRRNGNEYFFAYLDDYPDSRLVFDNTGIIQRQRERSAFDNFFVYCPADGTLESIVHGGKQVREPLEAIFAEAVLGIEIEPEGPGEAAYALDGLKDFNFALPTEPSDGISEVRVRRLRLEIAGGSGRRITLETKQNDAPNAVYQMMERYLNAEALPAKALRVAGATFTLTFASVGGAKPKTLTFDVGHPSSCDLKSKTDEQRAIGERCLKLWKVSRG